MIVYLSFHYLLLCGVFLGCRCHVLAWCKWCWFYDLMGMIGVLSFVPDFVDEHGYDSLEQLSFHSFT